MDKSKGVTPLDDDGMDRYMCLVSLLYLSPQVSLTLPLNEVKTGYYVEERTVAVRESRCVSHCTFQEVITITIEIISGSFLHFPIINTVPIVISLLTDT